jgi:uncharacterized protein YgiM (DUF1202 family)
MADFIEYLKKDWKRISFVIAVIAAIPTFFTLPYWLKFIFGIDFFYEKYILYVSEKFNPKGFIYYEPIKVGSNEPQPDAAYTLLQNGTGNPDNDDALNSLARGDTLIARTEANLRAKANNKSRFIKELQKNDCVIVLDPRKNQGFITQQSKVYAGYIYVVIVPCPNNSPR